MPSINSSHPYDQGPPSLDAQKAWQAAVGALQLQVTADTFEMYLHPARFMAYEDGTFLIAVPNGFAKDWLEMRLNRVVKRTLQQIMNRAVEVRYTVQPVATRSLELPEDTLWKQTTKDRSPTTSEAGNVVHGMPLTADYTFERFIVGPNNRLAHAAAVSVASQPGKQYNPLFLYSGVGLGKTHLLHAIGHHMRRAGRKVVYVSCEYFTNELVTAIRTNTQEQFRAKYRTSDVLLVDDVHFLVGKSSTQEELFHTFNAQREAGRQVVLASDRPPNAIPTIENRLRSRFQWGLIVDIQAPDLETRLAILQAKAAAQGVSVSTAILEAIAELVPSNVRELEGALTKVLAHSSLSGVHLSAEEVRTILADVVPPKAQITPETLLVLVARAFDLEVADLTSASRKKDIVLARQVAMYVLREDLELPFVRIGELLGGRDHATAMHSVRKISDLMESDDSLQRQVGHLREQMRVPVPIRG